VIADSRLLSAKITSSRDVLHLDGQAAPHRVSRIHGQVGNHLLELSGVRLHKTHASAVGTTTKSMTAEPRASTAASD